MFERFTADARDVVRLAQDEARGLLHDSIGTEHLLLALVGKPELPAAWVLAALGAHEPAVRAETERMFGRGTEQRLVGQIPFTPDAKKALELALREALSLGHNYIGSEHLLLGLLRIHDGGTAILAALDVNTERLRAALLEQMPPRRDRPARRRPRAWLGGRGLDWMPAPPEAGWEYRIEHPAGTVTVDWLNELGEERWELVGPAPAELGGGLIFKRRRPVLYLATGEADAPG